MPNKKIKDKIDYVLFLVTVADKIPRKFFEQMTGYGGLFAIRIEFEIKAKAYAIGEILRATRKEAHMTQEELARKTGTRKSFISRIENGHSDI